MKPLFFLLSYDQWSCYCKKILLLLSCLGILFISPGWAQSPILDEYLKIGLEQNNLLRLEKLNTEQRSAAVQEAKGAYYPQVSFQASYTLAGGGRIIAFPVGDLLNPVYGALNQLTNSDAFPNIANVNEQFLPNDFHETKFRVVQPLFNTDIYYNYRAQQALLSVQEAKRDAYKKELTKEIKRAYYQYLQAEEALKIYQDTKTLLQEVLRSNQRLVKSDKATPEIVYSAEADIQDNEKNIAQAERNLNISRSLFNFLLNRSLEEPIQVDTNLITLLSLSDESLADLERQALGNRQELKQIQNAQLANEQLIKLNTANALPKVNLVGDVGYQGFGYRFNGDQDFWLMQISLSWDLFKGRQNRQKIRQSEIEDRKLKTQYAELEKQIQLQVQDAFYNAQAAQKSVVAAQAALISNQRNFRLTRKKYDQGQALYVELLESRTRYTNAQLALVVEKYSFLSQQAELERAAGL